jgi:hypothetical protein
LYLPPQSKLRMHTTMSWQMLSGGQSPGTGQVRGWQYAPAWQVLPAKPGAQSVGAGGTTSALAPGPAAQMTAAIASSQALRTVILILHRAT